MYVCLSLEGAVPLVLVLLVHNTVTVTQDETSHSHSHPYSYWEHHRTPPHKEQGPFSKAPLPIVRSSKAPFTTFGCAIGIVRVTLLLVRGGVSFLGALLRAYVLLPTCCFWCLHVVPTCGAYMVFYFYFIMLLYLPLSESQRAW